MSVSYINILLSASCSEAFSLKDVACLTEVLACIQNMANCIAVISMGIL